MCLISIAARHRSSYSVNFIAPIIIERNVKRKNECDFYAINVCSAKFRQRVNSFLRGSAVDFYWGRLYTSLSEKLKCQILKMSLHN